jgi:hypothetical protein
MQTGSIDSMNFTEKNEVLFHFSLLGQKRAASGDSSRWAGKASIDQPFTGLSPLRLPHVI